jgi:Flp pilus assembly protein TadB
MSDGQVTTVAKQRTQRRAIGWGAGLFIGIGIGGALAFALGDWLLGLGVAVVTTLVVAGVYLVAGHATAERRAAHIVAREEALDEDEDDDGTY